MLKIGKRDASALLENELVAAISEPEDSAAVYKIVREECQNSDDLLHSVLRIAAVFSEHKQDAHMRTLISGRFIGEPEMFGFGTVFEKGVDKDKWLMNMERFSERVQQALSGTTDDLRRMCLQDWWPMYYYFAADDVAAQLMSEPLLSKAQLMRLWEDKAEARLSEQFNELIQTLILIESEGAAEHAQQLVDLLCYYSSANRRLLLFADPIEEYREWFVERQMPPIMQRSRISRLACSLGQPAEVWADYVEYLAHYKEQVRQQARQQKELWQTQLS